MKLLLIADQAEPTLWGHLDRRKLEGVDLVLSCGDLPPEYLEFLTCFTPAPILSVHGNHDTKYEHRPPEGCVCIDGKLYVHEGLRILGLGGSMRYKPGPNQYTEEQMRRRVWKLAPRLLAYHGFDILLAHAPARHMGDFDSLSHRGFECFVRLIDRYQPKYFVHGHIHMNYGVNIPQRSARGDTTVINAYEYCLFDYEQSPQSADASAQNA